MIIALFLIDRKKLKMLIPAYLLSSAIGFSLDVIFDFTLKYYYYIDAPIPNGVLSFLMETLIGPPFGMIFIQYLPKNKKSYILYLIVWILLLTAIEAIFHIKGLLVYNRWNYFFSIITYVFTLTALTVQNKYLS
ncbi:CBO0543 family protein [Thermoanaerobacterium sp. CMT5567-10]|uniref:CBO0543 family protein n=1 Tax=Thermoanaerobacterium sp. CMT5567-10 TaxID=3061989 RepID=UPI00287F5AE9|nr:CBO0543 family protein [Thermoanaerobacterium sp. CMT5567-10]WKV07804.2 CBO0543 family protein [Thermoanaerobacterium sp. CMT5567-10]